MLWVLKKCEMQIAQVPLGEKIRKALCHEKMYVEDSAAIKSVYTKLVVFYMYVHASRETPRSNNCEL